LWLLEVVEQDQAAHLIILVVVVLVDLELMFRDIH
jgi:hypothetical protein